MLDTSDKPKMSRKIYALHREGQEVFPIKKSKIRIGRHTDSDVVINNIKVSRFHANICVLGDSVFIEDLKTTNGTFIASDKILAQRLTNIRVDDVIGVGCVPTEDKECSIKLIQVDAEPQSNGNDFIPAICQDIEESISKNLIQHKLQNMNIKNVNLSFKITDDAEGGDNQSDPMRRKISNSVEIERVTIEGGNRVSEYEHRNNGHSSSATAEASRDRESKTSADSTSVDKSRMKREPNDTVVERASTSRGGHRKMDFVSDVSSDELDDGDDSAASSSSTKERKVRRSKRREKSTGRRDKASRSKSKGEKPSSSSKSKHDSSRSTPDADDATSRASRREKPSSSSKSKRENGRSRSKSTPDADNATSREKPSSSSKSKRENGRSRSKSTPDADESTSRASKRVKASSSSRSKREKPTSSARVSSDSEDSSSKRDKKTGASHEAAVKAEKSGDSKDDEAPSAAQNETQTRRNGDATTSKSKSRRRVADEPCERVANDKRTVAAASSGDVKAAAVERAASVSSSDRERGAADDCIDLVADERPSRAIKAEIIDLVEDNTPQSSPLRIDLVDDECEAEATTVAARTYTAILDVDEIDISSDDECVGDKALRRRGGGGGAREKVSYSKSDDIISLDSDDEDFPSSQQLNATMVDAVPNYSSSFQMLYDYSDVKEEPPAEAPSHVRHDYDSTWFEPLSQSYFEEKMVPKAAPAAADSPDHSIGSPELLPADEPSDDEAKADEPSDDEAMPIDDMSVLVAAARPVVLLHRDAECEKKALKRRSSEAVDAASDDELSRHSRPVATKSPFRRDEHTAAATASRHLPPPIIAPLPNKRRKGAKKTDPAATSSSDGGKAAKKRGGAHDSPFENPTQSQKQRIKDTRRERLRKLTADATAKKESDVVAKPKAVPVVKVTDKNRNTLLAEALVNDNRKEAKTVARETNGYAAETVEVAATSNGQYKWTHSGDADLAESLFKQSEMTTARKENVAKETRKSPTGTAVRRRRSEKVSKSTENAENENAQVGGSKTTTTTTKKKKKRVMFQPIENIREVKYELEERLLKSEVISLVRSRDQTFCDCVNELDAAIAHMCSWSVHWLKEQMINQTPPPVYTPVQPRDRDGSAARNPVEKWRENLKFSLFLQLWKALFNEWNTTGNNIVPNTQCINEKNVFVLTVEKVDIIFDKNTLVIKAARPMKEASFEIQIGQVVILNLQVTCPGDSTLRKTMIFGYVSNVMYAVNTVDSQTRQLVWIKTSRIRADIVLGPIKLKVIQFMRKYLVPFQALALLSRSPLTNCILNPPARDEIPPERWGDELFNEQKYLGVKQKKAITKCLEAIYANQPSMCVVDGIAGTGKSQIIVSLIGELYATSRKFDLPQDLKILIITPFDNNADDLCYRMLKKGSSVNVLRYGNDRGAHQTVKSCSLQKKIEDLVKGDSSDELIDINAERNTLQAKIHSTRLVIETPDEENGAKRSELTEAQKKKRAEAQEKLKMWQRELDELNSENSREVERLKLQAARRLSLAKADVVITSSQTCWTPSFEQDFLPIQKNSDVEKFTVCIIDDADRLPEFYVLSPIMLMVSTQIFIGDSMNRISCVKTKSLFDKMRHTCATATPKELVNLDVNYRLNPTLYAWIYKQFAGVTMQKIAQRPFEGVKPLVVIDFSPQNVASERVCDDVETDYLFVDIILEVDKLEKKQEQLDALKKPKQLGVVVFDNERKENLKVLLNDNSTIFDHRKVVVDRMEEFSGREQDIIIVDLPHTKYFDDSFLYNIVTRTRKSLVVCGYFSHSVLKRVPAVASLVEYAKSLNCYVPNPTRENLWSSLSLENPR